LEKGLAYDKIKELARAIAGDWPAYRYDGFRSGITKAQAPSALTVRWEVKLPTKPSAVTSAAGKVFVCDIDTHTLYALDNGTGHTKWTFTADGRIDSPPAYYRGMVLFGSRDGWVYCLRASDGALAWRFKDLPDKLIGAYGQLESKWPVSGSVVIVNDTLYFAAGRCSYLDGGIFLYALDPRTGELLKSRSFYGPFSAESGFPIGGHAGFKNDVLVTDGTKLYLRHKAFDLNLADAAGDRHIIPTGGFLDGEPQHRTCWTLAPSISTAISGDIMVSNGKEYYEVRGFPIYANHSYFDPRKNGYTLFAGTLGSLNAAPKDAATRRRDAKRRGGRGVAGKAVWRVHIPITGKAIAMAGGVLFVAGEPMRFDDPTYKSYVAAYNGQLGGRLLAVSATDGKQLAEYTLDAAPAWDSIAIANEQLYIGLEDGTVQCLGQSL
jgi:outer membrane protein assembly factor BamB